MLFSYQYSFLIYITFVFRECAVCLHHSVPIKVAEDIVIKELLDKSLSVSRYRISKEQSIICGNKMPTGCNRGFYCRSYCLLNMFRAPLCPSSGAQSIVQWLLPVGFRAVVFKLLVWCGAECYVSSLQDAGLNTTDSNHCIILLSSWWWA